MIKTVRINMVIPEWLKDAVKLAANNKGISMTQYILDSVKETIKHESKPKADDN